MGLFWVCCDFFVWKIFWCCEIWCCVLWRMCLKSDLWYILWLYYFEKIISPIIWICYVGVSYKWSEEIEKKKMSLKKRCQNRVKMLSNPPIKKYKLSPNVLQQHGWGCFENGQKKQNFCRICCGRRRKMMSFQVCPMFVQNIRKHICTSGIYALVYSSYGRKR